MFKMLSEKIKSVNVFGWFIGIIIGSFIVAIVAAAAEYINPPLKEYKGGIQNHLIWNIKGECFFVRPAVNTVYLIRIDDCDKGSK